MNPTPEALPITSQITPKPLPTGILPTALLLWRRLLGGSYPGGIAMRTASFFPPSFIPQESTLVKPSSPITRRTLLKQAAVAGVGAVALPQLVPSSVFGANPPSNKLNIAVFACGGQARGDMAHAWEAKTL